MNSGKSLLTFQRNINKFYQNIWHHTPGRALFIVTSIRTLNLTVLSIHMKVNNRMVSGPLTNEVWHAASSNSSLRPSCGSFYAVSNDDVI